MAVFASTLVRTENVWSKKANEYASRRADTADREHSNANYKNSGKRVAGLSATASRKLLWLDLLRGVSGLLPISGLTAFVRTTP